MPEPAATSDSPPSAFTRRDAVLLAVLLLAGLAPRLLAFNAPAIAYQSWRETDTLMIARNYARSEMNLFRPEVDRRSSMKMTERGYIGGTELPVTPWLTAWVYRAAGFSHGAGRVVPIAFALLGGALFFLLARRFLGSWPGFTAALLLLFSPFHLYLGRVQMPETFAYAMAYGALLFLDRWCQGGRRRDWAIGAAFAALMLLGKPQLAPLAVPMAFLVIQRFGRHAFIHPGVWAFALAAALPAAAWVYYSFFIVLPQTGISFAQPGLMSWRAMLTDPAWYARMGHSIFFQALTPGLAILAAAGLFLPGRGHTWFAHAWLLGGLLLFVALPGGCDLNSYYHMVLAPPAALLAARLLARVASGGRAMCLAAAAAVVCAGFLSARVALSLFFAIYAPHYDCGTWVRVHTPPDARVMTSTASPATLYFADRVGWTCWARTYGVGAGFKMNYFNEVRALGATHLAVPFPDLSRDPELRDFLYKEFRRYQGPDFTVFFLREKADSDTAQSTPE